MGSCNLRIWLVGILVMAGAPAAFGVIRPAMSPRADLKQKMERSLCSLRRPPSTREAWALEIFDAQIEGQRIRPRAGFRMDPLDLEEAARLVGKRFRHNGMTTGQCRDGSGWVLTSPSPEPLLRKDGETLALMDRDLGRHCKEIRFDYAAAAGGLPRRIRSVSNLGSEQNLRISVALLEDGVLSISCQPHDETDQGPVVWYLAPVKQGPPVTVPFAEVLADKKLAPAVRVTVWLNRLRAQNGVAPLATGHPQMGAITRQLAKSQSLLHDRHDLRRAEVVIKKAGGKFLGENRVKGASLIDMAWLLWNSPRHRGLLLDGQSSQLGVTTTKLKDESFAVLTFAKL